MDIRRWMLTCVACVLGMGAFAATPNIIGTEYRADKPFPEFMHLWQEGWSLVDEAGHKMQYARRDMPLGGYVHVFFRNPGSTPLEVGDILLDGVSLVEGVRMSERESRGYYGSSIRYSKLPKEQIDRLVAAGSPVWWKVNPEVVAPGGLGEVIIRLRRAPAGKVVKVSIAGTDISCEVATDRTEARFESVSFSESLDTVYLYLSHPSGKGVSPARYFLDEVDVTGEAKTASDPAIPLAVAIVKLNRPLDMNSFHVLRAVYGDGSVALAGVRAWQSDLIYGMWGSRAKGNSPEERTKEFLTDMLRHNINVHMGMYSGDAKQFMESTAGWDWLQSVGMRQMATWFGNARKPIMYFLQDEPDAQDFGFDDIPAFERLGTMGMWVIRRSKELRKKDPKTPQLLNLDGTYKPENWYTYGQLGDINCADPYYQGELDRVYNHDPGSLAAHSKPTSVYATGTICQWAGAPRPLHLILCSTKYLGQECPGRFPTAEEKRIEVYYALAAGAKGLSFWWYTPVGDCYGCGADDPEAVSMWKEIGLLGAEVRTAGPVITKGCPVSLQTEVSNPALWVRSLLSGLDTAAIIVVNDNILCDRVGTVYRPIERASVEVSLPAWLKPTDVFEITYRGIRDQAWKVDGNRLSLDLGTVDLSRFVIVTGDAGLRARLQAIYDEKLAGNVAALTSN